MEKDQICWKDVGQECFMKNHHLKSLLKDEHGHHVPPAICRTRWDTASGTCFRLVCADSVHCQGQADPWPLSTPEAWLPPAKPVARPTHLERQLSVHTPHHHAATILLPKPTVPQEAACSLLPGLNLSNTAPTMAGTVVLIAILVYTDLAAQVIEHLWVRAPWLPCLYLVIWCLPATQIPPSRSSHLTPLSHPRTRHGRGSCPGPAVHPRQPSPRITWGPEDEQHWRKLSFSH